MRSFIAAVLILVLLILLSVTNAAFVTRATDRLLAQSDELRASPSAEALTLLCAEWQAERVLLSLTVNRELIDRAELALINASDAIESIEAVLATTALPGISQNGELTTELLSQFSAALDEFTHALRLIASAQRITLENVI